MEIEEGIEIIDLGLFIKKYRCLAISDLQIGYEEALNKEGFLIPRFQYEDMLKRMSSMIAKAKPKKIIINGDLKHGFSGISKTEWSQILKMIDFLSEKAELAVIKGNHDVNLEPILKKRKISLHDHLSLGDIYLCHGDAIPKDKDFKKAKTVIIGHEHPAICLREHGRAEKFKCFLKGKYKGKNLIVLPSCNVMAEGTDVLTGQLLSPFLKKIRDFQVYVVADVARYFGKVKDLITTYL